MLDELDVGAAAATSRRSEPARSRSSICIGRRRSKASICASRRTSEIACCLLVDDRLERIVLPVPAIALRIDERAFCAARDRKPAICSSKPPVENASQRIARAVARAIRRGCGLRARAVAEHRPEKAWAKRLGGDGRRAPARRAVCCRRGRGSGRCGYCLSDCRSRPLEALAITEALELGSGPERIESGWWDEHDDAGRDYYTAKNACGQRLWMLSRSPHSRLVFARAVRLTRELVDDELTMTPERHEPTCSMPSYTASATSRSCAGRRIRPSS